MGSINRVTIMGIVGHKPELKFSRGGKPFVYLSLATHKRFKDEDGNTRRETQWHRVMLWGKNAEVCSTFCEKGAPLYIEGHLAPYTKSENGVTTYHLSVMADQIQFIPGSKTATPPAHFDEREFEGASLTALTSPSTSDTYREENSTPLN